MRFSERVKLAEFIIGERGPKVILDRSNRFISF